MGEYLSRKYAPLPVTKGTRIPGGLFVDVDEPMMVIGILPNGDVIARIVGSYVCHIIRDVAWFNPPARNPEADAWWAEERGRRLGLIG